MQAQQQITRSLLRSVSASVRSSACFSSSSLLRSAATDTKPVSPGARLHSIDNSVRLSRYCSLFNFLVWQTS